MSVTIACSRRWYASPPFSRAVARARWPARIASSRARVSGRSPSSALGSAATSSGAAVPPGAVSSSTRSRSASRPSCSASRQMAMAAKVVGHSHSAVSVAVSPASNRCARAISCSRVSNSVLPMSRRNMRTGSVVVVPAPPRLPWLASAARSGSSASSGSTESSAGSATSSPIGASISRASSGTAASSSTSRASAPWAKATPASGSSSISTANSNVLSIDFPAFTVRPTGTFRPPGERPSFHAIGNHAGITSAADRWHPVFRGDTTIEPFQIAGQQQPGSTCSDAGPPLPAKSHIPAQPYRK